MSIFVAILYQLRLHYMIKPDYTLTLKSHFTVGKRKFKLLFHMSMEKKNEESAIESANQIPSGETVHESDPDAAELIQIELERLSPAASSAINSQFQGLAQRSLSTEEKQKIQRNVKDFLDEQVSRHQPNPPVTPSSGVSQDQPGRSFNTNVSQTALSRVEQAKSAPVANAKQPPKSSSSTQTAKLKKVGSKVQFVQDPEDMEKRDPDLDNKGSGSRKPTSSREALSKPPSPNHAKAKHKSGQMSHDLFVELHELQKGREEWQWREQARWIKFEEDVEEGAQRWGKPHVPSLTFHSLLELRECINRGVILLNLEAYDIWEISEALIQAWISEGVITEDIKENILEVMLATHRPQKDSRKFIGHRRNTAWNIVLDERRKSLWGTDSKSEMKRRASEGSALRSTKSHDNFQKGKPADDGLVEGVPLLQRRSSDGNYIGPSSQPQTELHKKSSQTSVKKAVGFHDGNQLTPFSKTSFDRLPPITESYHPPREKRSDSMASVPGAQRKYSLFPVDDGYAPEHNPILKCLAEGAEGSSVMVGTYDKLQTQVIGFIRLDEVAVIDELLEVAIPLRFIFVILGPPSSVMDYREIGRSIGTLLANKKFRETAYQATDRQDLLGGLHRFLDDTVVIPAGDVDKDTLLPVLDDIRRQVAEKRKKQKEQDEALKRKQEAETVGEKVEADKQVVKVDRPLERTGHCFGGVIKDIKRRYPKYPSDIKDALNMLCLAVFFFIFFACLSPAITFGGLLGQKTEGWMGVTETLFGTCVSGIFFHIFAGQPLLILGHTGPLLLFESALFDISASLGLDFMGFRFWVCIWVTIISFTLVGLEGSFLVRYITRFTEEIFASLISILFIYEVFVNIAKTFEKHPLSAPWPSEDPITTPASNNGSWNTSTESILTTILDSSLATTISQMLGTTTAVEILNQPNTALISLILTMSTFGMAYTFRQIRASKFFGRSFRQILGDFGVPLSIIIMVLIDLFAIKDTYTDKLNVPDGLTPTKNEARSWIVNPMGVTKQIPIWACFAAVIPALLAFILIFMETEITSIIVNKKERKMKKGSGFHLDILIIGLMTSLLGIIGCPLLCSATVRSVTHVNALTVYSQTNAPGEKPNIIEVKEQRLTGLTVHIALGVATLLGPVLRQVPLPVLFGIFLYMGVASINGIQLFERVELFFVPVKHHPDVGYVRRVRTWKMHFFTVIQLICFAILWIVKSTQAALAFPFILILMVPFRLFMLPKVFTKQELSQLDKTEETEVPTEEQEEEEQFLDNANEEEKDAYGQAHMPV